MEFDIQPQESMARWPRSIGMPLKLRSELGVLEGQFIQLQSGSNELVLRIMDALPEESLIAYVSPENHQGIKKAEVHFEVLEITLGCDPEFFVLQGSRQIRASVYLPTYGEIGCDGELGELRPHYGRHEDQVVANLAQLISQIPGSMRRSDWAKKLPPNGNYFTYEAHSYLYHVAAGFHIHLGIPPEILQTKTCFDRSAMNYLVQCLDWYVSVPLVPLEADHRRRTETHYGRPGHYRVEGVTLEYRTPGAFYLRSPELTTGLLGLALLVVESVVGRMKVASKDFTTLHKLGPGELQEIMAKPNPEKVRGILKNRNPQAALSELGGIRKQLEALPTFGKHTQAVNDFFRIVEGRSRPGPDMLLNWKEKL